MARLLRAAILIAFVLSTKGAFAACHAVTPGGSGSRTGADWNNAFAGLPGTLVRGDIYYLADGNYGHQLTLSTAESGTRVIELRKAQSYDNCTSTGWNTGTMGSAQAVWTWGSSGSMVSITSGYWTINGNGNGAATEVGCGGVNANPPATMLGSAPTITACGIKIDASTCPTTSLRGCDNGSGEMHGGGSNIIWKSVEWKGQGLNSNGNNDSETYFWFATPSPNMVVTHSYLHNASTTYITNANGGWDNGTFSYNYCWGLFDGSNNHGEALQDTGTDSGTVIHHNVFRDQNDNGVLVFVDPVSGTHSNFQFYDNFDWCSQGNSCRHSDGVVACINSSQTCTGFVIANNVIMGGNNNCGITATNPGSYTVRNNIWYNCSPAPIGGNTVEDHNSWLNSGSGGGGTGDVTQTSGAPNPFVNWPAGNFNLAYENALWNNRANLSSLGAQYNIDLNGATFTTDRGAVQYGGLVSQAPQPPTALSVTVN
jgi:hypothetical protein